MPGEISTHLRTAGLIEEHLGPLREQLGLTENELMALGRVSPSDGHEEFCMTILALKVSRRANAVSSLHGHVSRAMWTPLYPGASEEQVPIGHITNGIHVRSWLAPQMHHLYDRHLGPDWPDHCAEAGCWDSIDSVEDGELWETHQTLKTRLIEVARLRAARCAERRGEAPEFIDQARHALSLDALTIGFARRFATYKRANLVLRDMETIAAFVNDAKVPIQFVFAGKAHPQDRPGKEILQQIVQLLRDARFGGKLLFIEDVVLNGGLNLSILDGWWAEAYDGLNGFAIGRGETHASTDLHDMRDAEALLRTLREDVIPLYYDRDRDGLPRGWIARMKRAIRTLGWRFSADRMVTDYVLKSYIPAAGGTSSEMRS